MPLGTLGLQYSATDGHDKLVITFIHTGIVRDQALHALGDGSPGHLEERIIEEVEKLYNDPFPDVKKKARRMMNSYRKTGKWNVL